MAQDLILFSGTANPPLAAKIAEALQIPLGKVLVDRFYDGETRVELQENVRGREVFIIQPTSLPANHHVMEALIMVDACRRASAGSITLVVPYFGYGRQERKTAPRGPITAKLAADIFEAAGIARLLTVELHNSAIQGFFNVPVDHLQTKAVFSEVFRKSHRPENSIIISPDAGGVERARVVAKEMGCGLAIVDKRRDRPNESSVMHVIGEVRGQNCLIVDDIVDTGGSLIKAAAALIDQGANTVSAAVTHAVLSNNAVADIAQSKLTKLAVSDSIMLAPDAKKCPKITEVSVADLIAKAIARIYHRDSVSSLFV